MAHSYPKRLIEVDLPIRRISAHSRREKSIRHGHISTLHIWWARRPLAACRAVICAALWPDPADPQCPKDFIERAQKQMQAWTKYERQILLSAESRARFEAARKNPRLFEDRTELRCALLDFLADFSSWDSSTVREFLDTGRALTQAAHEALLVAPGDRPLVVDPFAGGGSIPIEALRVGADSFASDLNPIAVLLNVVLEKLDINEELIAEYLAITSRVRDGVASKWPAGMFAKFWARTIRCEGPACGIEIPLVRGAQISRQGGESLAFRSATATKIQLEVSLKDAQVKRPVMGVVSGLTASHRLATTCKGGSVTCPACGFTHKQNQVARQALNQGFGRRMIAVGVAVGESKTYRAPTKEEEHREEKRIATRDNFLARCLDEKINPDRPSPAARGMSAVTRYGYANYRQLFSEQQLDVLERLRESAESETRKLAKPQQDELKLLIGITLDRLAAFQNTFCRWAPKGEHPVPPFGKNGFPMIWDYVEANPFGGYSGSWDGAVDWVRRVLEHIKASRDHTGEVQCAASQSQVLPDEAASAWITDPPYYDSYPYADLSDFFYPILRASLTKSPSLFSGLFADSLTPKDEELVLQPSRATAAGPKDHDAYRLGMTQAFRIGKAITSPKGIAVVVFANKTTAGWEAFLGSVCDAGWTVTASWPIDTERESRAAGQARLQSSVHLVCRPRHPHGSHAVAVGDWRDLLLELPRRIHEWMPRLAEEGIVGADAIFACLGPALEIFSRFDRVERVSGEVVALREYLEEVWAAVAKEALSMVFAGADTSGFEADARLTAMWLWTLSAKGPSETAASEEGEDEEEDTESKPGKSKGGLVIEYDAARKIAQGLGADLEDLDHLVEISGQTARLLPVAERTNHLFGKDEDALPTTGRKKRAPQEDLFSELMDSEGDQEASGGKALKRIGHTTLDRVHQCMVLFAANRSVAIKRFLVEEGVGRDTQFWRLAQSLSALYPSSSSEKRWVDGVLARKRGLGF